MAGMAAGSAADVAVGPAVVDPTLGAQMRVDAGRCGHKAAYRQLTGSVLAFYWELTGSLLAAYASWWDATFPTMAIGRDTSKVP